MIEDRDEWDVGDTLRRAREARESGRLWKAKEILGGCIGAHPYNPAVYEEYGVTLLSMGDDLNAGRFLFLCGSDRPEYDGPIQLFLGRFAGSPRHLYSTFPARAKLPQLDLYPSSVERALRAHGVKPRPTRRSHHKLKSQDPGFLTVAGGVMLLLVLLASLVVGFYTLVDLLFGLAF